MSDTFTFTFVTIANVKCVIYIHIYLALVHSPANNVLHVYMDTHFVIIFTATHIYYVSRVSISPALT